MLPLETEQIQGAIVWPESNLGKNSLASTTSLESSRARDSMSTSPIPTQTQPCIKPMLALIALERWGQADPCA